MGRGGAGRAAARWGWGWGGVLVVRRPVVGRLPWGWGSVDPRPRGKCNSAIPVHSPGLLVHQKEEDGTNMSACMRRGNADRDVPCFGTRRYHKDMHQRRHSSRPRRSQRKTQAEPEKVPKASEVLGRMPTCPQGPGHTALHQRGRGRYQEHTHNRART